MATCHPCVISVFSNELIPNAITISSQFRPGGKNDREYRATMGGGESDWLLRTPSAANQILSTIVAPLPIFDLLPN